MSEACHDCDFLHSTIYSPDGFSRRRDMVLVRFLSFPFFSEITVLPCVFSRTEHGFLLYFVQFVKCRLSPVYSIMAGRTRLIAVFLKMDSFLNSFRFKFSRRHWDSPSTSWSHTRLTSLIINIPHQRDTLATTDEPTLTYPYHSKFIIYIRIHSWCWTDCEYHDMYPPW